MARKKYNEMSYWQLRIRPDHGLFVGFASVDDSEIAMAVRITNGYMARNAVACGKEVFKTYFKVE